MANEEEEQNSHNEESKVQTLFRETKMQQNDGAGTQSNATTDKGDWTLEPKSVKCSVDIVDPTREGFPLLRRITLCTSHGSISVGPRAGKTRAVDKMALWNSDHEKVPFSIVDVATDTNIENGPNIVCLGNSCCFKDSGLVKSWTVRTTQAGRVVFTVLRRISRNKFKKIGQNCEMFTNTKIQSA